MPMCDKVWVKIWNMEFVDFGVLLTNLVFENQYRLTFRGGDSSTVPSLSLEPMSRLKKIITVELWLRSFHIFVAVYTKKCSS